MLTRLIELVLRHRLAVCLAWLAVATAGVLSFRALPVDAFPDTTPTQVQVNTVAPALAPLEVERQITSPLEQALAGLPHVEELRSISKFALSQITIRFSDDADVWSARQQVAERVFGAGLPVGVGKPALGPLATGLGEVFHYLVEGPGRSLEELRTLHDRVIAPELRGVPGVAEVNAWGGHERQWHVVVDPRRLQAYDLAMGDVYEALERNNANVGGGVLERGGAAALVLGVGALTDGAAVAGVVIAAREGVPVRVRDVATVEVGHEIRHAAVTADGKGEAMLGLGFMLTGENSHAVTRALAARLAELAKTLPAGVTVTPVYERTELVDLVLRTVRQNLFEGALLVVALLFVFLGNLRAGLVVALAIPLSLLFAFSAMLRFGVAGTLMSLGAIDFGLVVDSSVIVVENAERRLGLEPPGRSLAAVVRDAAVEVRKPTLFGELIIALVYLPVLTLEGIEGKLFRPMASTVVFTLLGSVLLSLTLTPVLASFVLKRRGQGAREPRLVAALGRAYRPALAWALGHPRLVLFAAVAAVVSGAALATRLGSEFVPRLSEGTVVINTVRLADVSLTESIRIGLELEKLVLDKFPDEVARVWTRTGTPEVATDPMGVELSDLFMVLTPRERWTRARTQAELVEKLREELEGIPGMRISFTQPIEMRVNEMVAGIRSDVGIKVFGDDLDILRAKAAEIEAVVRELPGAADVSVEQVTGQPVLEVTVDREAIARYGIAARDVLDVVEALGVRPVGEVREGLRRVTLGVRLAPEFRDAEALGDVLIPGPGGERIPLARLASMQEVVGPTTLHHERGKRRVVVQVNVRDGDLGAFVAAATRAIDARVELPAGTFVRFGGQHENLERARTRLSIVVPLALTLVFLLLYLSNRSVADSLRIFTGVPFALVGGVVALLARGLPFSVSAAVGFIALFGVAVLNGLVLVSRIRQLLERGAALEDAVPEAARSRLRPVLMTAAVAAFGFLPMALATGPGAEVQRPLATVVIGGVLSSTLLTVLVLPVLFTVFAARRPAAAPLPLTHDTPPPPRGTPTAAARGGARAARSTTLLALFGAALVAPRLLAAQTPLTLDGAVEMALARDPELEALAAATQAETARAAVARRLVRENPELEIAAGPRLTQGGGRRVDYEATVSQELEIFGQRSARREAAVASLTAAHAALAARRVELTAQVRAAFIRALAAERTEALARRRVELARETLRAAAGRLALGEGSKIERNTAELEVGRALQEHGTATRQTVKELGALRLGLALEPAAEVRLTGTLEAALFQPGEDGPHGLAERAVRTRPDLAAARASLAAVTGAWWLAAREWLPRPRLGVRYEREETSRVVQGTLTFALPVLDQGDASRDAAAAEVERARAALRAIELRARHEVWLAHAELEAAARTVAELGTQQVARAAAENLTLAAAAYAAGKLDLLELVTLQRGALEAQQGLVEALATWRLAEVELARAAGGEGGPEG